MNWGVFSLSLVTSDSSVFPSKTWGMMFSRRNYLKWHKPSLRNIYRTSTLISFILVQVPSANTEQAGFMTYTAASHQGAIGKLWPQFRKLTSCSSIFTQPEIRPVANASFTSAALALTSPPHPSEAITDQTDRFVPHAWTVHEASEVEVWKASRPSPFALN